MSVIFKSKTWIFIFSIYTICIFSKCKIEQSSFSPEFYHTKAVIKEAIAKISNGKNIEIIGNDIIPAIKKYTAK